MSASGTSDAAGHCEDAGGETREREQETIHLFGGVGVTVRAANTNILN